MHLIEPDMDTGFSTIFSATAPDTGFGFTYHP